MTDLMIILGAPASGKSTLARRLAGELSLCCLCKDDVKEAMFDVFGTVDRAGSRRLSDASFAVLLRLAAAQAAAAVSCLLEGNWRPAHAAAIRELDAPGGLRIAQIECRAAPATLLGRFRARVRHPGHLDGWADPGESGYPGGLAAAARPGFLDLEGPRWVYDSEAPGAYAALLGDLKIWRL